MENKCFAFVGSWALGPGEKGLSIYAFALETGELTFLRRIHPEISVGYQYLCREAGLLYVTDEAVRPGITGGYVQAFRLDGEEGLRDFSGAETLLPKPSCFTVDRTGDYALAAHHSGRGTVTKLERSEAGSFSSRTVTDDAGVVLFRREPEGGLGQICDVYVTPGRKPGHPLSHQHCVTADPTGELYLVCDKGQDAIYSFRLDWETGRLMLRSTVDVNDGYGPRYVAFHPETNLVYENNENKPVLLAFRYDPARGTLTQAEALTLAEEGGGADLVMHPGGKLLYASLRGANRICAVALDGEGKMRLEQSVDCGGDYPRGLCLSPDGRFLLCANQESGDVTVFALARDGRILDPVGQIPAHLPANLTVVSMT